MTASAYLIPKESVEQVWPGAVAMIDEAYASADEVMPTDILDQLRSGHRQLWVVWGDEGKVLAAVMTRVIKMRSCTACQIMACGGDDGERWMHLIARIHEYAKGEGCSKVLIEGRSGWERIFKNYKRIRVVLEMEI